MRPPEGRVGSWAGRLATIEAGALRLRRGPGSAPLARGMVAAETWASASLAGAALTLPETRTLLERGIAAGSRPLRDYLLAWGYGDAVAWIARAQPGRPLFTLAELRALHVRACKPLALLEPAYREAGEWRTSNAPPAREGLIYLPPALIAREIALLIDRCAAGPPPVQSPFVWLASFHERFDRIRPFALANGRAVRLMLNLALVRLGYPLAAIVPRDARAYRRAREAAQQGDPLPLAYLIARSVARNVEATGAPRGALLPLAALAGNGLSLAALRKAAMRGRLRHAYIGARIYSTLEWREAYLSRRRLRSG